MQGVAPRIPFEERNSLQENQPSLSRVQLYSPHALFWQFELQSLYLASARRPQVAPSPAPSAAQPATHGARPAGGRAPQTSTMHVPAAPRPTTPQPAK